MPDGHPYAQFVEAAVGHGSLERANAILAAHPAIATSDIHAAAILGDDAMVRRFLDRNPEDAVAKGGPRGWDALTHLCFSRYLRLDPGRSSGFVRAAEALLDAGASANTGYYEVDHHPEPVFESALYGAAGMAHHAELTRLLIDRGADPNDEEVPYHAPETHDNSALKVLVESGKVSDDNLAVMLLRKHDWHDYEGVRWLLEHGADPNRQTRWRRTATHQAVLRDNSHDIFEVLLDHGANPTPEVVALAARRGRGALLALFDHRGVSTELDGADALVAACARNQADHIRALAERHPELVREVRAQGGMLLAQFSGNGNTDGMHHLLDLGIEVDARYHEGDPYWDVATESTALHVAAWRAQHTTVRLLIERGAAIDLPDGKGRTPLALAVRACVNSYWAYRRSPVSVMALLQAGASVDGIDIPSGYEVVDALLRTHRA
jgi:ankyrin repeat protein